MTIMESAVFRVDESGEFVRVPDEELKELRIKAEELMDLAKVGESLKEKVNSMSNDELARVVGEAIRISLSQKLLEGMSK